ncbi:hypothetical protein [Ancylomarina sp. 16SWW S1-10-2]|uniref:hypothetical protein n=1 Tax=Ancylomarina sp. 16SWW S1-10-2 TaxID=2499681 RepID=UPI0012AE12BB|nr:hypothetical protein [Ancylomarina sp. 16SWW S1-10-2]MRT92713.1 hypothetical protein [Ancylomarina sp. 16SWW S1-10-2]
MIVRESEILDTIGKVMFIAFFMLILSSFSNKVTDQSKEQIQLDQAIEYLSGNSNTIIMDQAKVPSYSQHLVSRIDRLNLNTFNENFKIIQDNRIELQQKIFFKNLALTLKPLPIYTRSIHLYLETCDDNFILS